MVAACAAAILLAGHVRATEPTQTAKVAEHKAEVLEQSAAATGAKTSPPLSKIITKTEVQAVDPVGEEPLDDAITCLSRSIYWEAKNEGAAGMEAVASVVMNRLSHKGFPKTICGVVREGSEQGSCQFSWWCDGHSDHAEEEKHYEVAKEIARKALNKQLHDRTAGAMYFHTRKAFPDWSAHYIKTATIGDHIFYKPPGAEAK